MSTNIYTEEELRYFRLAKGVINYSTAALRKVFKDEWNYLYPATPWRNDGSSGSQMLAEENAPSRYSRLFDPNFANELYQAIKDHLRLGHIEEWDITTLVFALLNSHALSPIRNSSSRWRRIKKAVHEIKNVRNRVLSHASKASISRRTFDSTFDSLKEAMKDLLPRSHPLIEKLKTLRTETEFVTDDLVKYKKLLQQDYDKLLKLDKHIERLECKIGISSLNDDETSKKFAKPNADTSKNSEIIAKFCSRVDKLEHELSCRTVDLTPSRFKPPIFHSARYIRMVNKSSSMSYNFCWEELGTFLEGFKDDVAMQMFADIQTAVALSHQSKKEECLKFLKGLIPKALLANQYGVVLSARIKIRKAYILHDLCDDDAAMKEVDEAEVMLSLGECHEDLAEINCAKANIILSSGRNSVDDRKRILHHLEKCIHFCEKATVDKSVTATQAKLRKALFHLGYYQNGILEGAPDSSDMDIARTILDRVAKQAHLAERSKVYLSYGKSLLAYRSGEKNEAIKMENKLRRKCERHQIRFEIKQLDMLKTLFNSSHVENKVIDTCPIEGKRKICS